MTTKLTAKEVKILNAMRTNEYQDCLQDYGNTTWSFTVIDNSGMDGKQARGAISSLVKKGLVTVSNHKPTEDNPETIAYTQKAIQLFETADGEDNKAWGGKKLLKEVPEKGSKVELLEEPKQVEMEVEVFGEPKKGKTKSVKELKTVHLWTFTGMDLGIYTITKETASTITITGKKGDLTFSKKTLTQTNCKNPKFANKITL